MDIARCLSRSRSEPLDHFLFRFRETKTQCFFFQPDLAALLARSFCAFASGWPLPHVGADDKRFCLVELFPVMRCVKPAHIHSAHRSRAAFAYSRWMNRSARTYRSSFSVISLERESVQWLGVDRTTGLPLSKVVVLDVVVLALTG